MSTTNVADAGVAESARAAPPAAGGLPALEAAAPPPAQCANCGAPMTARYCPECGQRAGPVEPKLADLVREHATEFLNVDGRVFRSVLLLLTRPGYLTAEFFAGRKARYVSPLRLYLLFSVIYFAVDALMPNPDSDAADAAQAVWAPRVVFMLVPVAALLVLLVTRRTGKHYPQHWYFVLHVHAAYFALLTLLSPFDFLGLRWLTNLLSVLHLALLAAYATMAFRTAYGGSWPLAIGRAAGVLVAYFVVFVAVIAAGVVVVTAGAGS